MNEKHADEVRWLSEEERAAWLAVAGLSVKLPGVLDGRLQADAGLTFFEYMVLAVLSEQPDRTMQMSDIAAFASASLSRLSHTASRLERQGYLTRRQIPGHGRRTQAELTAAGYDKVRATAPGHVMHVRRILIDVLSEDDLAALARIGERVLRAIEGRDCD
jgi:DNA-binding MarR family transcriptional regulator